MAKGTQGREPIGLKTNGERISSRRKLLAMSQETLAGKAGVSGKTIQRAEAGDSINPEHLKCIAQALDVALPTIVASEEFDDNLPANQERFSVTITISGPALGTLKAECDWNQFVKSISQLFANSQADLIDKRDGSVVLTVAITQDGIKQLITCLNRSRLGSSIFVGLEESLRRMEEYASYFDALFGADSLRKIEWRRLIHQNSLVREVWMCIESVSIPDNSRITSNEIRGKTISVVEAD
jgi:transcriptional regulator with XRE-family HTH domain